MSSLFGIELPTAVNFVIAFVFVMLLIGAAAWLVRRFGAARIDAAARGRQPRLAVVDSAAVDGRRKLVIIRRDNVEHLLMVGGPSDVVVETNIVRATAAPSRDATTARDTTPTRDAAPAWTDTPRVMPSADPTQWPLQPEPVAVQPQPTRAPRVAPEDTWPEAASPAAAPEVRPVRQADTLAGLAEELAGRPAMPAPRPAPTPTPPPRVAAPQPAAAPLSAAADQSLAEMAQRLEAALRRPMAQKVVAETARVTATVEVKAGAPKLAVPPRNTAPAVKPQGNLEQEMASLLSRPGKT
jgi:flagellar biogenesis protein FliO